MNVLYIHTHDTGRYIQPYGYPVQTPNLMELAKESTLFRNAYCAGPTCSPSRAALLTGMAPHSNGMFGLAHRGFSLHDYKQHLAHILSDNGYETALCGIQHETEDVSLLGYRRILGNQEYSMGKCDEDWHAFDVNNAKVTAEYITETHDKPFFLSFGMFSTHRKFPNPDGSVNPDYILPPSTVFDNPENRRDMAGFLTMAKTADECVRIVMDALRKSGEEDNTVVIFTTDHGIAFPQNKCNLYDTGIGVSLMIKYPGNRLSGKATDALVSQVDIIPTLCELCGIKPMDYLQGASLVPLLEGKADNVRNEVFSEVTYHVAYEPMRCIRTGRYKLIRYFGGYDFAMPSNTDDSPSKAMLMQNGFFERPREKTMLFDLYMDPLERVNVAQEPGYAAILRELSDKLTDWMEQTDDPLLSGKVIPPAGALVNYPQSASPAEKIFIKNWEDLL